MKAAIESIRTRSRDLKKKMRQELAESKEMAKTLGKMMSGEDVPDAERKAAFHQVVDIMKGVVMAGLVVVPGGSLIFLLNGAVNKALGTDFSLKPSSFREANEQTPEQIADRVVDTVLTELDNVD